MQRPPVVVVIAGLLMAFGLWRLFLLLPLLGAGFTDVGSVAGRAAQCVLAIVAGAAIWLRLSFATAAVWLLGLAVALTALYEAFVPGIVAPLLAVLQAIAALLGAALLVRLVQAPPSA
jgi:hypothetical protein